MMSTGRNDPCPCGSGRKHKQCCMRREQAAGEVQHRFGLSAAGGANEPAGGVWQVDLMPLPVRIGTEPNARPAAALVVEAGVVLDVDLLGTPPSEAEEVAAELERVVARTAGRLGSWPRRVAVRDAEVAGHLSERLAARQVEVVHSRRLDELDFFADDLRENLAGAMPDMPAASSPETWRGWGLPSGLVAELFGAAADFWRRAPWRWIGGEQPLFAEEGTSRAWTCCVLGNLGEQFGLALYAEEEDFLQMFEEQEVPFAQLGGPVLSLTYDRAADLPKRMRREVTAAGWEVAAPEAYPVLMVLGTPGGGLPRAAAEDLVRLLRIIPDFVERHPGAFDPLEPPEEPLEWSSPGTGIRLRYEGGPGEGPEWLEGPWKPIESLSSCLPQGPDAEPAAALEPAADRAGGIDALAEREQEIVERFERALREEGLSEATVRKHATNAATFVEMLAGYQAIPLRAVTEYDLRAFLFDLYPRKVMDARYRAEAMPTSLSRFFDFLGTREGIVCPWAGAVLAERDEYRERVATFPGGFWWDEGVAEWRAELEADLIERALVHWPRHADETPWGPMMGPLEAALEQEVQRRWLLWRDEAVGGGLTDPGEVRAATIRRQLQWEQAPHPELEGRTPLEVVQAEWRERESPGTPGPEP